VLKLYFFSFSSDVPIWTAWGVALYGGELYRDPITPRVRSFCLPDFESLMRFEHSALMAHPTFFFSYFAAYFTWLEMLAL
jgi:hypothetical protein